MSDKEVVIETLRQMPEAATLEQISEEIAILAALRKGDAAADVGQVTPHEEFRQEIAPHIAQAQITEVRRRIAQVEAGKAVLVPGAEALAHVRQIVASGPGRNAS